MLNLCKENQEQVLKKNLSLYKKGIQSQAVRLCVVYTYSSLTVFLWLSVSMYKRQQLSKFLCLSILCKTSCDLIVSVFVLYIDSWIKFTILEIPANLFLN